ncbi:surfeit locus protein 6-domain-containing protein [Myxozyma melibiosi]|uniref:Surfeit locus protein 6-domain-containing protein n=1 Tax=Myxozyma melibiosi TaxID=54550 RepID=A0ABR1F697_9ASCO
MARSAKFIKGGKALPAGSKKQAVNGSTTAAVKKNGISKVEEEEKDGDGAVNDDEENGHDERSSDFEDIDDDEEDASTPKKQENGHSEPTLSSKQPTTSHADATQSPSKSSPSIDELRERLAQKIKNLRAQRKAPGSGTPGAPLSRDQILKARQAKEAHRKEKEALKRKRASEEEGSTDLVKKEESVVAVSKAPKVEEDIDTSGAMFSKVLLDTGDEVSAAGEIKPKKRKKGPSDLLGQLKHVEAKKARIASMDEEKRRTIEEKEKWKRAIKQAEGEKVRDDEVLLKKSLKKQFKQKKKSAREWKEREENVQKGILARQKKREENIAARREQKAKGGSKKKSKSSGLKKKKKRPGFEGGPKKGSGGKK